MPPDKIDNVEEETLLEKTLKDSMKQLKKKKVKGMKLEHLAPWQYKKGQCGNPGGMPKGTVSMKVWLRNKLGTMSEDEREEFVSGLNKLELMKMAEGNPAQDSTIALTGKLEVDVDAKKKIDEVLEEYIKGTH